MLSDSLASLSVEGVGSLLLMKADFGLSVFSMNEYLHSFARVHWALSCLWLSLILNLHVVSNLYVLNEMQLRVRYCWEYFYHMVPSISLHDLTCLHSKHTKGRMGNVILCISGLYLRKVVALLSVGPIWLGMINGKFLTINPRICLGLSTSKQLSCEVYALAVPNSIFITENIAFHINSYIIHVYSRRVCNI